MNYNEISSTILRMIESVRNNVNRDEVIENIHELDDLITEARNEICLHCGLYKKNHIENGCKDCRWKA